MLVDSRSSGLHGQQPEGLAHAWRYLPVSGLVIGLVGGLVYMVFALLFPHAVAVICAIAAMAWATGAAHERRFAQYCEAATATRAASLVTDSFAATRVPSGAIVGLVLLMVLRIESLAQIEANWTPIALACAHPFSRACAVLMMFILPRAPVSGDESSSGRTRSVGLLDALIALLLGTAPLLAAAWWFDQQAAFLLAGLLPLTATIWFCRHLYRRWRGHREDSPGAAQQIAEFMFYLGLLCWLMIEQLPLADTES